MFVSATLFPQRMHVNDTHSYDCNSKKYVHSDIVYTVHSLSSSYSRFFFMLFFLRNFLFFSSTIPDAAFSTIYIYFSFRNKAPNDFTTSSLSCGCKHITFFMHDANSFLCYDSQLCVNMHRVMVCCRFDRREKK